MQTAVEHTPDTTASGYGCPGDHTTKQARLWCPETLPDGTRGHWFLAAQSAPFICSDTACRCRGHVVYQCPLHRGFVGRLQPPPFTPGCEGEALEQKAMP